jgi:hypothetical protein
MRQKWWWRWHRHDVQCHYARECNGLVVAGEGRVLIGLGRHQDLLDEGVLVVAGYDDCLVL